METPLHLQGVVATHAPVVHTEAVIAAPSLQGDVTLLEGPGAAHGDVAADVGRVLFAHSAHRLLVLAKRGVREHLLAYVWSQQAR